MMILEIPVDAKDEAKIAQRVADFLNRTIWHRCGNNLFEVATTSEVEKWRKHIKDNEIKVKV